MRLRCGGVPRSSLCIGPHNRESLGIREENPLVNLRSTQTKSVGGWILCDYHSLLGLVSISSPRLVERLYYLLRIHHVALGEAGSRVNKEYSDIPS